MFAILKVVALVVVGPHPGSNLNPDMKAIGVATVYASLTVSLGRIESSCYV